MKKQLVVVGCTAMFMILSGCGSGPYIGGKDYQLPQASPNGLLVMSFSYDVPGGKETYVPPVTPSIKVEPAIEEGDSFGTRYKKLGAIPNQILNVPWVIQDNKRVCVRVHEWQAGNYTLMPEVTMNSGSIIKVSSFTPRKVTVVGGKVVYAGNFYYSGLQVSSSFLTGATLDENCRVLVHDEFSRDMALCLERLPAVSGNETVKDIRNP
jgi:hypothetical protein